MMVGDGNGSDEEEEDEEQDHDGECDGDGDGGVDEEDDDCLGQNIVLQESFMDVYKNNDCDMNMMSEDYDGDQINHAVKSSLL